MKPDCLLIARLAALAASGLLSFTAAAPCGGGQSPRPYGLEAAPRCKPFLNMPPNDKQRAPALLSQTGALKDVRTLTPADGLIAYDLNFAFWSDGASKSRWIALPAPDKPGAENPTIDFSPTGEWSFPAGTVFVKHFAMATDLAHADSSGSKRRLETRLLVRDDAGGVYGVTYKWRPDNSDADRVDDARADPIEIKEAGPARTPPGTAPAHPRTQNWFFPGPLDCRTCHTPQAGLVLGVKTRQLNRDYDYPAPGGAAGAEAARIHDNQLRAWNHAGLLRPAVNEEAIARLPRLARADDPRASAEDRARSYLDANCSHCHRPGGSAGNFDARYDTPLARQNLIDGPVLINLGLDRARVIAPNDVWRSVLLARLTTLEQPKMPPLAHETIDSQGVRLVEEWIKSLPGPPVLAPPAFSPAGGEFKTPVKVRLTHEDPGAVLRYTLDGSVPNKSSPVYQGPIEIKGPTTLRAKAFKDGATRSITAQETYIVGE